MLNSYASTTNCYTISRKAHARFDVAQGTSTLFDYDLSGNITARHVFPYWAGCPTSQLRTLIGIDQYCTTVSYGYSAGTWGDMLTSYNGTTISYDAIGNPANWRNGILLFPFRFAPLQKAKHR